MLTMDAQVHAYEGNHPGRPWAAFLHGTPEVTGDDMAAAMDAVGVDGAILVSPFAMCRDNASQVSRPDQVAQLAERNPSPRLAIDDLGLQQRVGPAGSSGALRRPAEGADPGGARQHRHHDHRRLHAIARALLMGGTARRIHAWTPTRPWERTVGRRRSR
jgi:hypothetical protein